MHRLWYDLCGQPARRSGSRPATPCPRGPAAG
jgi:hypothetical protein